MTSEAGGSWLPLVLRLAGEANFQSARSTDHDSAGVQSQSVGPPTDASRGFSRGGSFRRAARPPTPRRWPRIVELAVSLPNVSGLEALGAEAWGGLHSLRVDCSPFGSQLGVPSARTLTAALRRMPALRALDLGSVRLPEEAAEELFRASSAAAAPQLRALTLHMADLSPAAARMLAASGWRLEELVLRFSSDLGAAGVVALVAAPTFHYGNGGAVTRRFGAVMGGHEGYRAVTAP